MMNTCTWRRHINHILSHDISDIKIKVKAEEDTITEKKPKRETRKTKRLIEMDS